MYTFKIIFWKVFLIVVTGVQKHRNTTPVTFKNVYKWRYALLLDPMERAAILEQNYAQNIGARWIPWQKALQNL